MLLWATVKPFRVSLGRVEVWRGGSKPRRRNRAVLAVGAPLAAPTPSPHPAHRTGRAHFAHPALGERFTRSPTESCRSAREAGPSQAPRAGSRRDTVAPRTPVVGA